MTNGKASHRPKPGNFATGPADEGSLEVEQGVTSYCQAAGSVSVFAKMVVESAHLGLGNSQIRETISRLQWLGRRGRPRGNATVLTRGWKAERGIVRVI